MIKLSAIFFSVVLIASGAANAQVVVDGKNVNEDRDIEYLQFSFYYESKDLQPVYFIDFGSVLKENTDIRRQKISIDGEDIMGTMTPAYVLNKLYRSGWEYLGDMVFMKTPMIENTQLYTLRRRAAVKR